MSNNKHEGTCGNCRWKIDETGTMTICPVKGTNGMLEDVASDFWGRWPWSEFCHEVKKVKVEEGVKTDRSAASMFFYFDNCEEFDLAGLDPGNSEDFSYMFWGCHHFSDTASMSGWDMSRAEDIKSMFSGCYSLKDLQGLADWDVSHVKNMQLMFFRCENMEDITHLKMWNTGNVLDMSSLFDGCLALRSVDPIKDWDTGNVRNMEQMFYYCGSLPDKLYSLAGWDLKNVDKEKLPYYISEVQPA